MSILHGTQNEGRRAKHGAKVARQLKKHVKTRGRNEKRRWQRNQQQQSEQREATAAPAAQIHYMGRRGQAFSRCSTRSFSRICLPQP